MVLKFQPEKRDEPQPEARPAGRVETGEPKSVENISVGEDSILILGSNDKHNFHCKNIRAGDRSLQIVGSFNTESGKELHHIIREAFASRSRNEARATAASEAEHGTGRELGEAAPEDGQR